MVGASTIADAGDTAGASNIPSASDTAGVNNTASTDGILIAVALQGASITAGARALAGVDHNPSASGSTGANQPFATTYPVNLRDNVKMLEIKSNMDATPSQCGEDDTNKRRIEFRPLHLK
jgi:hypothetical protein